MGVCVCAVAQRKTQRGGGHFGKPAGRHDKRISSGGKSGPRAIRQKCRGALCAAAPRVPCSNSVLDIPKQTGNKAIEAPSIAHNRTHPAGKPFRLPFWKSSTERRGRRIAPSTTLRPHVHMICQLSLTRITVHSVCFLPPPSPPGHGTIRPSAKKKVIRRHVGRVNLRPHMVAASRGNVTVAILG
jgi:hypothetical protein